MVRPVPLSSVSAVAVENLLDAAFGCDRHQRTAYLLRQGMPVIDRLSFGILAKDELIGSIQCWPIAAGLSPLILVGPVAVTPDRQRQGIGKILMQAMLESAVPDDAPMVMIGDLEYYGRFGFSADHSSGWTLPGPWEPHRLLLRNPAQIPLPSRANLGPRHI
ncbi:N-acetyltransferase [Sphingorhabdus sp. IMCC26285]|uniref:N-acetyltransferase n=1 Tax=Sphingorhabdus profundilacus TaxID=2509718 RepID=A0A6I4LYB1_9SPHN|nr:N-acetyltransferase [Sphingorhabdus profundilacus]MVZ96834.1 N-acetyltransferase [Sphingorhabdus profundilacus]